MGDYLQARIGVQIAELAALNAHPEYIGMQINEMAAQGGHFENNCGCGGRI